jgi:hypothetical protein
VAERDNGSFSEARVAGTLHYMYVATLYNYDLGIGHSRFSSTTSSSSRSCSAIKTILASPQVFPGACNHQSTSMTRHSSAQAVLVTRNYHCLTYLTLSLCLSSSILYIRKCKSFKQRILSLGFSKWPTSLALDGVEVPEGGC